MHSDVPAGVRLETAKKWVGVVVAVGSVLLGGSLGRAALAEANAAPRGAGQASTAAASGGVARPVRW